MKTKKLLSLLLALMMMLSVVPFYASAAEPIALTEANVTVWPTASGSIYFGQKISDGITLSGGEVQYDGAVVAGHFEFIDPELRPTSATSAYRSNIKFMPDDTNLYIGFEVENCSKVTFAINKATPVFIDENDTVPVATEVEVGAKLSTSTLSGAKVKNPYYDDEPKALAGYWRWVKTTTVINESGYQQARMVLSGYEVIYVDVYVKVKSNAASTTITEVPTVETMIYKTNRTYADISLVGGKAVDTATGQEVTGTFAFTNTALNTAVPSAGSRELEITFTPDDTEKYLPSTTTITVTVNPAPVKFVDENGTEIVPEITVPYGTKIGDMKYYLEPYAYGPEVISISVKDCSVTDVCATGTYTAILNPLNDSNYEKTEKEFKIIIEPKKLEPTVKVTTEGYYVVDDSGIYKVQGTFDIYVDDVLVQSGIKYLEDKFELTFPTDVSKTYTIKIVYNPVENDNFVMDDIVYESTVIADRNLTFKGIAAKYKLGDDTLAKSIKGDETISTKEGNIVKLESISDEFAYWIITDTNGNEVDLDIKTIVTNVDENGGYTWETVDGDLTSKNIVFTMPTYDIILTQKTTSELAAENCDHLCHSDNPLFQMLWKVLNFIFRLFDVQQYCDCGNLHYDKAIFG